MKNTYSRKVSALMLTGALTLGIVACDTDRLNPVPKNQFTDKVVFDTPDRILAQVNNLYSAVKAGSFLGGRTEVYGDVRAEDFLNRSNNGVTAWLVWNHTVNENSQNDVTNMWAAAYFAINQANVFIDGMEANKEKFTAAPFAADYATTTAVQSIAEARFLRAISYHYLLQFYAKPYIAGSGSKPGLPLRLNGEVDSNNNDLARSTVDQVYTQIIADLDFAEANLIDDYGDPTLNTTRAHKNTAIAFKTRVYLTKGDYAKVISEASKIVGDAAPFDSKANVDNGLLDDVTEVFTVEDNREELLALPYSSLDQPAVQAALGQYYRSPDGTNPGTGEFTVNTGAESIFADNVSLEPTDDRRVNWFYQGKPGGDWYLNKYTQGTPYLDRVQIIRWAEVLLNYSEAIARTTAGVDPKALALVNAVRTRSNGTEWAPADNATLIDNIMTERRIEFLGEGLRNQDIMRLLGTFPGKGSIPPVDPSGIEYVWPIPSNERGANGAIGPQNSPND